MEVDSVTKSIAPEEATQPEVVKTPEVATITLEVPENLAAVSVVENNLKPSEAVIENSTNEISEVEKAVAVMPPQEAKIESTGN